jgi:amino acid transporter
MAETSAGPAATATAAPANAPAPGGAGRGKRVEVDLPEPLSYRIKRRLLGPALTTDQLEHERLAIPTALAVFSSDCISSSAYATEEILRVLVAAVGFYAFSLVVPITLAMVIVLFFLILSYRQTIKEYPTAGGAYMVTRDNFGLFSAQIAGVALLTDYILTVAVSTAAGTAALVSLVPSLGSYTVEISLFFIVIIAAGNLKGVRESGVIFAVPTYFFIAMGGIVLALGAWKMFNGDLHPLYPHLQQGVWPEGASKHGIGNVNAIAYGAGLYAILHAFASGGAAVTGVEAISNGVTAFKKPEWKNAQKTLVIMGFVLGTLFLGLSTLATKVHPVPFESGTPTVIAQIGQGVFGGKGIPYGALQIATMLILVLAANTSFADFPRLASFQAGDSFMPKQLTKRGHRLVFSNGIITLAACAAVLVIATGAKVDRLIPLYAIGVFTSFTLSQFGMTKHHYTRKEPGWRRGMFINGFGGVLSFIVLMIVAVTKFSHGAWVIIVLIPLLVIPLFRLNRQYLAEAAELEHEARAAAVAPVLRRHVVLVPIDKLDNSSARAIQYARTLVPDELRALHAAIDSREADHLAREWTRLGLSRVPLDIVDCPDRRVARCIAEMVAEELSDGDTEVSVLVPQRHYRHAWHRLLHDSTAARIADSLDGLPHANVTFVPYHLSGRHPDAFAAVGRAPVTTDDHDKDGTHR